MTDECVGCIEYDEETKLCAHVPEMIRDECPCRNCLIKMMCENLCSPFRIFLDTEADKEFEFEKQRKASMQRLYNLSNVCK